MRIENLPSAIENVLAPDLLLYSLQQRYLIKNYGRGIRAPNLSQILLSNFILLSGIAAELFPYVVTYLAMSTSGQEMTPLNMLTNFKVFGTALLAFSAKTLVNNTFRRKRLRYR